MLTPETETELDGGECPVAAPFNDGVWWGPDRPIVQDVVPSRLDVRDRIRS